MDSWKQHVNKSTTSDDTRARKASAGFFDSSFVATILIVQGMVAMCVGVGLSMASFVPPRPVMADVASGVLIGVGLTMLGLSFWIRRRSITLLKQSRETKP